MNDKVYVGIDCGDLQMRATYVSGSKMALLPSTAGMAGPLVAFDPLANISSLGVGFPPILEKLGTGFSMPIQSQMIKAGGGYKVEMHSETLESFLTHIFTSIRQAVMNLSGGSIGSAVLAVPAGMRQGGRQAFLDCAAAAGFPNAALVDRCTAAALGHHHGGDKTTALVFNLGYGDCEYSLLRFTNDRCRVVASENVPRVSGEALEALIMEEIIRALRKHNIFLGLKNFTSVQWLEFRRLAENVRCGFCDQASVTLTLVPILTGLDRSVDVRLHAGAFAAKTYPIISKAIDGVRTLLEQNELEMSDVDVFLLTGSVVKTSPVSQMLAKAFGKNLRGANDSLVAMGAAWQALRSDDSSARIELPFPDDQMSCEVNSGAPQWELNEELMRTAEVAEVLESNQPLENYPVPKIDTPENSRQSPAEPSLSVVKQLLVDGRRREAAVLLNEVIREVLALKVQIEQEEALTVPRALVEQAQAMLNTGKISEAVGLSHEAYQQAPGDPQIFSKMMKIHAEASIALDSPEEYELAIHILKCAHSHDQTDKLIHKALADRHFRHALAMKNLNNIGNALSLTNAALSFDPKHSDANKLLDELTRQPT